jgi:aldehyde dehydrogenase (NAD+)
MDRGDVVMLASGQRDSEAMSERREVPPHPAWYAQAQRAWAEEPLAERLMVLRRLRTRLASRSGAICRAIDPGPSRTPADVRASEILPLLGACEYLERHAQSILAPRRPSPWTRPIWLWGVTSEILRVPLGHVLVIGPSNYPLFLPGVQVLQALAAGNAVTWKPGKGGRAVALLVAEELAASGLPPNLLRVTEESDEAGRAAVSAGADKVFFTGSSHSGRAVLRALAETGTPSVMELSGCSAVVVLPGSDLARVTAAVAFGLRLNGSATCMAPRRLLVVGRTPREALTHSLAEALRAVPPVLLESSVQQRLKTLVEEAVAEGAHVVGVVAAVGEPQAPLMLLHVTPAMRIAQADLFAPVVSVIDAPDEEAVLAAERACPLALSASIFGEESAARRIAGGIAVGTVVVNDIIVPTADPRVPFGGRRDAGFGVTRGAEGLLEMTAVKTLLVRRGRTRRQFEPTGPLHTHLFDGIILAGHAETWRQRLRGLRLLLDAARRMPPEAMPANTKTTHHQTQEQDVDE